MAAVYGIFFAEVAAYRIGTKKLAKLGVNYSRAFAGQSMMLFTDN
jgi:hypothetical protein